MIATLNNHIAGYELGDDVENDPNVVRQILRPTKHPTCGTASSASAVYLGCM